MKDIPGELHEKPWVNFEHNRNEALSLAQNKADYILFMDADDYLSYSADYQLPFLEGDSYAFVAYNGELKCFWPRLIKASLEWEWEGAIHEQIVPKQLEGRQPIKTTLLKDIEYKYVHDGARANDPNTSRKDLVLLQEAILKNPKRARNVFYLAMTYLNLGDMEKGLETHQKRAEMEGFEGETFISRLSIPILQTELKKDSHLINESFFKAYVSRPHRAETLYYWIDKLEREGENEKAYQIASQVVDFPFYNNDSLFVAQWIFDYGLQMKYAFCSEKTSRYIEGIKSCQKLLARSDFPEAYRNAVSDCYERLIQKNKHSIQEKMQASVKSQ